jgi:hypothetical protein
MQQLNISSGPAATLLVSGDPDNPVPSLISNVDPANTLWIGEDVGVSAGDQQSVPIPPGQYIVASGTIDVWGIAAQGLYVAVNVYAGMSSFFQPITQLVIQGTAAAVLIYAPTAGLGNLIGSWAASAFTDQYGNLVPAGLNASGGTLSSMTIVSSTLANAIINDALINAPTVTNANMLGGTIYESVVTFDTGGGGLYMYASTTTTVSFTTPGTTQWTSPVTGTAYVRTWGADAGAGGGGPSRGGEGGGAGEYGAEPQYAVVQNQVYQVTVGQGGTGGTTGNAGLSGGDSGFDNFAVIGNGGDAGGSFIGGIGGQGSPNTIHFNGGNGGGNGSQSTGGCGGGGRAGSTGPGGNGNTSNSASGATGGTAGTGLGGIVGGTGGNASANGNNGGGGGGCGAAAAAATGTSTYNVTYSASYYGSDASGGNANGERNYGSPMYQGGTTASGGGYNGTMKSMGYLGPGNPQSDLAGKTIDSVKVAFGNQHSWYGTGMYIVLGYNARTSLPSSWNGADITAVTSYWCPAGSYQYQDVTGYGLGTALQNGSAKCLTLGPGTPNMNLWNYGYFGGAGSATPPVIQVNWHTGTQPVKAGNGANGQVQVTYTNAQSLVGALSPIAGTDAAGNAFAIGYTGPAQAIHPGSSPATVETWQVVTNPSGWSGILRYKLLSEVNRVALDMALTHTALTSKQTVTLFTIPAIYRPNRAQTLECVETNNTAVAAPMPSTFVGTGGSVSAFNVDVGTTGIDCHDTYPLD